MLKEAVQVYAELFELENLERHKMMNEEMRKKLGVEENKPSDWFEGLYSGADESGDGVPWANMAPHPIFKSWIDNQPAPQSGKTALVVGCGLGDDAIELEEKGYAVTAFDVAESAIALCKKRFPDSSVRFVTADLLAGVPEWNRMFDFVLEIFTIQALPPKYEDVLIQNVSDFVAEGGELAVIAEVQKAKRVFEVGPPWLLNDNYVQSFVRNGLEKVSLSANTEAEMGDEIHLAIFSRP